MADTLNIISVISFVMGGVFFLVTIVLWFVFKIPIVMGDLSGRTAKKSIDKMRKNNEKTGNKSFRSDKKNLERGKLTGTMKGLKKSDNKIEETSLLNENTVTDYSNQATGLLVQNSIEFSSDIEETAPLCDVTELASRKPPSIMIRLIDEVMYVHTEEKL